ncbi:MAG: hypothetical protein E6Q97_05325 [Desulfurellales bacterium]|nr:MAG: hypothetical protein E6Q97_05325 [Desulfurellales bacterium]
MTRTNSKAARRWRSKASSQFLVSYELECRVSDRVAILYATSRPYSFGIYGYPNENGVSHVHEGGFTSLLAAKIAARKALDAMADYPAWLEQRKKADDKDTVR